MAKPKKIKKQFRLVTQEEDNRCIACNGSGYYDHDGSPKCSSCNGTGKEPNREMKPNGH